MFSQAKVRTTASRRHTKQSQRNTHFAPPISLGALATQIVCGFLSTPTAFIGDWPSFTSPHTITHF